MKTVKQSRHWIGRIIGGIVIAGASFLLLAFWNTWELTVEGRILVSGVLGVLFLLLGGNIWRWIDNIDTWS